MAIPSAPFRAGPAMHYQENVNRFVLFDVSATQPVYDRQRCKRTRYRCTWSRWMVLTLVEPGNNKIV